MFVPHEDPKEAIKMVAAEFPGKIYEWLCHRVFVQSVG